MDGAELNRTKNSENANGMRNEQHKYTAISL